MVKIFKNKKGGGASGEAGRSSPRLRARSMQKNQSFFSFFFLTPPRSWSNSSHPVTYLSSWLDGGCLTLKIRPAAPAATAITILLTLLLVTLCHGCGWQCHVIYNSMVYLSIWFFLPNETERTIKVMTSFSWLK